MSRRSQRSSAFLEKASDHFCRPRAVAFSFCSSFLPLCFFSPGFALFSPTMKVFTSTATLFGLVASALAQGQLTIVRSRCFLSFQFDAFRPACLLTVSRRTRPQLLSSANLRLLPTRKRLGPCCPDVLGPHADTTGMQRRNRALLHRPCLVSSRALYFTNTDVVGSLERPPRWPEHRCPCVYR
jgi:hypothetical protein